MEAIENTVEEKEVVMSEQVIGEEVVNEDVNEMVQEIMEGVMETQGQEIEQEVEVEESVEQLLREGRGQELSVARLKAYIKDRNDERGVKAMNIGGNKTELLELAQEDLVLESANNSSRFAEYSDEFKELPLSSLVTSPDNPRHDLDYVDMDLVAAIQGSGLTKPPMVVDSAWRGGEPGESYEIVAGNRSVSALKYLVEELLEQDPDQYLVGVKVRTYFGSKRSIENQILRDLRVDNDHAKPFTSIDRLKTLKRRLAGGRSLTSLANEDNVIVQNYNRLMRLDRLPEEIQTLVHAGERANDWKYIDTDTLDKAGIPWEHELEDGIEVVKVLGVALGKAYAMAERYPTLDGRVLRGMNDHQRKVATQEWEDQCKPYNEVMLSDEVLSAATSDMTTNQFIKFLNEKLIEAGLIEAKKPKTEAVAPHTPEPTQEDLLEQVEAMGVEEGVDSVDLQTNPEPSPKDRVYDNPLVEALYTQTEQFIRDLECDEFEVTKDWALQLSDALKNGNKQAMKAVETLIRLNVIEVAF